MNHAFKPTLATLMLTMILTAAFSRNVIELKIGIDGNLIVPDRESFYSERVLWVIRDERIQSFQIKPDPNNSVSIFYGTLPEDQQTSVEMRVKRWAKADWNYTIDWKQKGKVEINHYDPKIAIRPPGTFTYSLLVFLLGAVASLTSRHFFKKIKS